MRHTFLASQIRDHWPLLGLIAVVSVLGIATIGIADPELDQTVTEALVWLVVVIGMYVFIGNSGVMSFGHVGFVAIGAYAEAWQTCCRALKPTIMPGLPDFILHASVPVIPAIIGSGVLAAIVALITGAIIMRLSGIALSIATFAFLVIIQVVYAHWNRVTAGTSSIIGIPVVLTVSAATVWAIVALIFAYIFQISKRGLSLRASRNDEVAARASGVNIFAERLIAYTLSAFFAGVGGALYSHFLGILSPGVFYLSLTFTTLAMLVVGGIGSLAGAVSGVIVISALTEVLRQLEKGVSVGNVDWQLPLGSQEILLGIGMLVILIVRPDGLTKSRELNWPTKRPSHSVTGAETIPTTRFAIWLRTKQRG